MVELSDASGEDWTTMAQMYKKLTVDVASRPIETLLSLTDSLLPFAQATGIHDNGCGPGPVLSRLLELHGPRLAPHIPLSCSDFSPAMIAQVHATRAEAVAADPSSAWGRVDARVLDAMDLSPFLPDASRSHVLAGWVYFMTADPRKCLAESRRVLGTDGVLGCSSWQDSDWMELMRVAAEVRPDVRMPEIPVAWRTAGALGEELRAAGFRDVRAEEVPVTMTFESYEALVELLTEKMPHMVQVLKDFTEEDRERVRVRMREILGQKAPTQPYHLEGVSLVAVGRK